jgi:murein DD-endopeptidase MepM/ murein hydrolase activator NlpD/predicted small secreted protein
MSWLMSIRASIDVLPRIAMIIGVLSGATTLAGCNTLSGIVGDPVTTGSASGQVTGNLSQPKPQLLGTQTAEGPYLPPANVGGGGGSNWNSPSSNGNPILGTPMSISTQALPPLTSSPVGSPPAMSAQPVPQLAATLQRPPTAMPPQLAATPQPARLAVVPDNSYTHTIESGESLYSIARRYDVTTQAIIHANGFTSPDKIFVGQRIIIPGRPDLLSPRGPSTQVAAVEDNPTASPMITAPQPPAVATALASPTLLANPDQPPASAAINNAVQPAVVTPDKFRWPVSGRVITDFAASKMTGINIEAPEGAAVRAAENGQVIYIGDGVEGYGNLILIRHANGYVSAYAHLKDITVAKGANVSRGDAIGTAGMTGSVGRPQLHFELRKGATPVDPVPLLAS